MNIHNDNNTGHNVFNGKVNLNYGVMELKILENIRGPKRMQDGKHSPLMNMQIIKVWMEKILWILYKSSKCRWFVRIQRRGSTPIRKIKCTKK